MIFALWILLSIAVGIAGRNRKFGFWGFFLWSMFVTPVLVMLFLLLTEPKRQSRFARSRD